MSASILELIEVIYSKRVSETIENKRKLSLELSKKLLDIDGPEFSKEVASLISDEEKSNKFIFTLAQTLILCKGERCDKELLLIDRLLSGDEQIVASLLSPVLTILVWVYLTRAFCAVSSIPKCHFNLDNPDDTALRPEYDGIEHALIKICNIHADYLSSDSYSLCLNEEDFNSSAILGTSKLKLYKKNKAVERKNKWIQFLENMDEDSHSNSPINYKDQVNLLQTCILIIHRSNSNVALAHIWILLGLCDSLSNQEIIPISLMSIDIETKYVSSNEPKIRINLEGDILLVLCKIIGRCLFAANHKKQKDGIKKAIYEKVRSTFSKLQKRSICEVMPYCSSFISSYLVLIERIISS
ncbi:putative secreted protein [Cryptosporidium canis]|uniref:Secreted protein n=1 Tax=Cryptosporidium canis TaxID=195482 RepID=A0ABQ8P950_9CRYT|nr:putative secreted protein [Cryptosporidium canis]